MENILKFIDMLEYFVNYDIENWIELDHNYFQYQHIYNSKNNKISILLGAENSFLLKYNNEIIIKHLASTDEVIYKKFEKVFKKLSNKHHTSKIKQAIAVSDYDCARILATLPYKTMEELANC